MQSKATCRIGHCRFRASKRVRHEKGVVAMLAEDPTGGSGLSRLSDVILTAV